MQQKLEREDFFCLGDKRIAQLADKLLDFIDDAVVGGTGAGDGPARQFRMVLAGGIDITGFNIDIGEVPFSRGLIADFHGLAIGFAIFIGPSRAADKIRRGQIVVIRSKQRVDFSFHHGREARVGDHADNLVTFVAPSKEPVARENDYDYEKDGYTAAKEQSVHILERPYTNRGVKIKRKGLLRIRVDSLFIRAVVSGRPKAHG